MTDLEWVISLCEDRRKNAMHMWDTKEEASAAATELLILINDIRKGRPRAFAEG